LLDIHCHISYGSDDGAQTPEEALGMIKIAARCGTKGIAVTPHSNVPGSYRNYFSEGVSDKLTILRRMIAENDLDIQLFSGQEIFMTEEAPSLLESGKLVTLNKTQYPLVEFDFYENQESVISKLERLIAAGYVPVVAHPERYAFVIEDEDAPKRLRDMGCILQVNKGSIEGRFGRMPFRAVFNILEHELADIVASDAHSPYMRTPDMRGAHEAICSEFSFDYADLLFSINPARVIQGKEIIRF